MATSSLVHGSKAPDPLFSRVPHLPWVGGAGRIADAAVIAAIGYGLMAFIRSFR